MTGQDRRLAGIAGKVIRLRSWTDYQPKCPKPGIISEGYATERGFHTLAILIGHIKETEPITDQMIIDVMNLLGWRRIT